MAACRLRFAVTYASLGDACSMIATNVRKCNLYYKKTAYGVLALLVVVVLVLLW